MGKAKYLFFISLISLYLELIFIRWLSSEIRIFAFLKNIPLIVSFVGLGLGSISEKPKISLKNQTLNLIFIFATLLSVSPRIGVSFIPIPSPEDLWIWGSSESYINRLFLQKPLSYPVSVGFYIFVVLLFLSIGFLLFFSLGEHIREHFKNLNKLKAYRANLLGSISGIVLFTLLSYFRTGPLIWFLVLYILIFVSKLLAFDKRKYYLIAVSIFLIFIGTIGSFWSPYYRISIAESKRVESSDSTITVSLDVNHAYYQQMANLDEEFLEDLDSTEQNEIAVNYNLPYELIQDPKEVLVVGAGAGNDVAAALRNNAEKVDAVDIDPVIVNLGKKYHPEQPYSNKKVQIIIDDARSYFEKLDKKYDTIVYGLLDSHTSTSSFSNLRLDNFVYTKEGFTQAGKSLKDNGSLIVSFAGGEDWLLGRISKLIEEAIGVKPLAFKRQEGGDGGIFVASKSNKLKIKNNPTLKERAYPDFNTNNLILPTDDWPYLYLKNKKVPSLYLSTLVLVVVVVFLLSRLLFGGKKLRSILKLSKENWHFFFLGLSFLLVEVKSINQLSLLFGSTWIVSSSVILGILLLALFANTLVEIKLNPSGIFAVVALFLTLLFSYYFDVSFLSGESEIVKFLVGGTILVLPLFFSGLIFSKSFKNVDNAASAYGANMFGAFLGGIIENSGMVIGIKNLVIIAAVFYIIAIAFKRREILTS